MKRHILTAVLTSALALASCATSPTHAPNAAEPAAAGQPSLCDVRSSPDGYIGTTLTLNVDYVTDSMTFTHLEDFSCPGRAGVILGNTFSGDNDQTFLAFREARRIWCDAHGMAVPCMVRARIRADLRFERDEDGVLVAYVGNIQSVEFRDE